MTDDTAKAQELYHKYGLQKANFIAFNEMQRCTEENDIEFWLHVINKIALIDIQAHEGKEHNPNDKWGNA